jgi:uncharacterized protein DUF4190
MSQPPRPPGPPTQPLPQPQQPQPQQPLPQQPLPQQQWPQQPLPQQQWPQQPLPQQQWPQQQWPQQPPTVPGYGQVWPPDAAPPGPATRTNSKATWALILGIVGMVLCGVFAGIPAIVLGHQARKETDSSRGTQEGRGMATAGFVLGIVSTVASVLYIAFMITLIATDGFGEGLENF